MRCHTDRDRQPINCIIPPFREVNQPDELTLLLQRIAAGDQKAASELIPKTYEDLKRLAATYLRRERPGHTLQATALVHETYLKLAGRSSPTWQDRTHFFALAARIMRRILTDHARQHRAQKRGSGRVEVSLDRISLANGSGHFLMEDLDEALTRLAGFAPRQAKVVELRFFGGMTEDEIAAHLEVCSRTIKRDWTVARAWLFGELK